MKEFKIWIARMDNVNGSDFISHSYEFNSVKDAAQFVKKLRQDVHKVDFVSTDDWKYNDIINQAIDWVGVFIFTVSNVPRVTHHFIKRPTISIDENNEFIDLNR